VSSLLRRAADRLALRRGALYERRLADEHLERAGRSRLDRWFTERHGTAVLHGPLAGLRYPASAARRVHHLTAKLLGAYEQELHQVIAAQIARRPPTFVDLGAADGYYAAGFACASPDTSVHAYEIDSIARRVLRALARENGVADRVSVHGPANSRRLAGHDLHRAFVLCDVEGAELDVLDGPAVAALASATVLVELHPLGDTDTGVVLRKRFEPTHEATTIEPRPRDPAAHAELAGAEEGLREGALDEFRFGRTRWALFVPRWS
jgi:hypothetical protein